MNKHPASVSRIRVQVLQVYGVDDTDLQSRRQTGKVALARAELAYRLWTETDSSARSIARLIGRSDHSAAAYAILKGAASRGISAATITELRGSRRLSLDWAKLAFACSGWRSVRDLNLAEAARLAGISRVEWRKVERGRSVSAPVLLRVCQVIELNPFNLLRDDPTVSQETHGKHEVAA